MIDLFDGTRPLLTPGKVAVIRVWVKVATAEAEFYKAPFSPVFWRNGRIPFRTVTGGKLKS